ncbi:MAG: BlaI/MecI/CopY family transcriptional regulator [Pyrinomonadaceae bacterium]
MPNRRLRLRGYQPLSDAVMDALGDLEQKSMQAIWEMGEANVGTLCGRFHDAYAYTTIMTTLDRLYKKGLLERRKEGRAFLYRPAYSQEEVERGVAQDVIAKLLDVGVGKAQPVLACIVDSVSEHDHLLLDELERLVIEKRRKLSEGES